MNKMKDDDAVKQHFISAENHATFGKGRFSPEGPDYDFLSN